MNDSAPRRQQPEGEREDPSKWAVAEQDPKLSAALAEREARWRRYVWLMNRGDEDALASLYDESAGLVYSLALRILGDRADAEEATLDVYSQVWRNASTFDPDRGSVATWLTILARSRALDRLRAHGAYRERRIDMDPRDAKTPERQESRTLMAEQRIVVKEALDRLSTEQREAIELCFFEGLSHSQLAERLGQPLGTVKTRIRLGMMKLKTFLGPYINPAQTS